MDITIAAIVLCLESQLARVRERISALKSQEKALERLIQKASSGQVSVTEILATLFTGEVAPAPEALRLRKQAAKSRTNSESETGVGETHDEAATGEGCVKTKKTRDSKAAKVLQFVTEHPGTTSEEIFAWCVEQGVYENNSADQVCLSALLASQKAKDKLFSNQEPGRRWHRYYVDEADAAAARKSAERNQGQKAVLAEIISERPSVAAVAAQEVPEKKLTPPTRPVLLQPAEAEEEPIIPPRPKKYQEGTLNGDLFGYIWDNDGVTIEEIRCHIAVSSWGNSAARNILKNVEAMKNHHQIFHERQKRDGATVIVYKAMGKDAAVSKLRQERQETRARERAAAPASGNGPSGDDESTEGHQAKKSHPPPLRLKIPSAQDDWLPAVIWLIKRLSGKCGVVEFETMCGRAKTELLDFGWDLSTVSGTVVENGLRKAVLKLQENGQVSFDPSGAILMDPDGDELEHGLEEDGLGEGHEDLKILLAADDAEEVAPQEQAPFMPSASRQSIPSLAVETVRQPLSLWRGSKQLNQAVRDMCQAIRELLLDRDDFDNGNDIANAFYEEGSKSLEYDPQVSFKRLEALARFSLQQMIARKEVGRDWEGFLVLADHSEP